jgi:hypothetical protein
MLAFAAELDRRPNRIGTTKSPCGERWVGDTSAFDGTNQRTVSIGHGQRQS